MEILTEFDELQEAMKRINLNESVMPYVRGILADAPSFNKVQKILDCPEMISAHKYLYDLDLDQLDEDDIQKIDRLYKLGCDRGFIVDDLTDWDADDTPAADDGCCNGTDPNCKTCGGDPAKVPGARPPINTLFKAKVPCWTVIYSAVSKDGGIKTGEAYSNAISATAAKADVKSKLSSIGYTDISILAIESCEADVEIDNFQANETEDIEENDMLRNRPHNGHIDTPAGVKVNEADKDEDKDSDAEEDKKEDSEDTSDEDNADSSAEDEEGDSDDEESDDESSKDGSEDAEDTEDTADEESDEDADDSSEDDNDEDSEESDDDEDSEESDDDDELDQNKKNELKDQYKKTFKNVLVKCKFETSFNDLTLDDKVKFFTELAKAWDKNEPNEFMTDKEIEQLNNVVASTSAAKDE